MPRPIDSTNTSLAGQRGIEPGPGDSRVNTGTLLVLNYMLRGASGVGAGNLST